MAVVDSPWDGSASRFTPQQWKRSALVDTGVGDENSKDRYKMPILEPNGDLNKNALGPALGALNGARGNTVKASPTQKKGAARKLVRAYRMAQMDIPDTLKRLAQ